MSGFYITLFGGMGIGCVITLLMASPFLSLRK